MTAFSSAEPRKSLRGGGARGSTRPNIGGGLLSLIWIVVVIGVPFYYLFITSFKNLGTYFQTNTLLPSPTPTLDNYATVLRNDILRYFSNSVFVLVGAVLPMVALSFLAAYGITRSRSRIATGINTVILLGISVPSQAIIIPVYMLVIKMGLYDSLWALMLVEAALGIPICFLILANYIRNIPRELFESMHVDGASEWSIIWRLALPLTRPAIMAVAIYEGIRSWNAFMIPLMLTQSSPHRTLPLALVAYQQDEFVVNTPAVLAAVVVSSLPLLVLYLFGRKQLVGGLTAGFSK